MDWSKVLFVCALLGVGAAEFPFKKTSIAQLPAAGSEDYRLPTNIIPLEYDITLEPLFENFDEKEYKFNGQVLITATAVEEINAIVLHAVDLDFGADNIVVEVEEEAIEVTGFQSNTEIPDHQTVVIEIQPNITEGSNFTISIKYTGILNDDDIGFYRAVYRNESGIDRYTHFILIFKKCSIDIVKDTANITSINKKTLHFLAFWANLVKLNDLGEKQQQFHVVLKPCCSHARH